MTWIHFTADYDWKPTRATTTAYKAGMTQFVTRTCATLAVAAGKAVRVNKKGETADGDEDGRRSIALPTPLPEAR